MPHPLLRTGRLLALCCCAALANTAAVAGEALDVRIGYLGYRPDPGPLLSNVIPEPEDAGLRGAELAITDSNSIRLNSPNSMRITQALARRG